MLQSRSLVLQGFRKVIHPVLIFILPVNTDLGYLVHEYACSSDNWTGCYSVKQHKSLNHLDQCALKRNFHRWIFVHK